MSSADVVGRALPLLPGPADLASSAPPAAPVRTLVDDFLAAQATMTAVERFAAADPVDTGVPAQARWYRDLVPATPPGPGQQYAFAVDLDACSGCKACVSACHSLNGLDEGVAFRDVGLLVGEADNALVQPVTTGCHHCADPGCLSGCPVDAYEVLDSGVVRHLDDQCIGCRYCTLTCPYEIPSYDAGRGIVRKCDLCHDRLADGEAPACVQACPTEAIAITVVDVDDVMSAAADDDAFPFDAPDASLTLPSTQFASTRDLATDVAGADVHTVAPREAHPPLVAMLVLTQLAVGVLVALEVTRRTGLLDGASAAQAAATALGAALVGMVASVAHLGRPHLAWRAVIGLRHSWLSREIVAFGVFAPAAVMHALALARATDGAPALLAEAATVLGPLTASADATGAMAVLTGVAAVGTSVMVYVATGRAGWGPVRTTVRFGLTAASLGSAGLALLAAPIGDDGPAASLLVVTAMTVAVTMAIDLAASRSAPWSARAAVTNAARDATGEARRARRHAAAARTARLLRGPLAPLVRARAAAGVLATTCVLVAAAVVGDEPNGTAVARVFAAIAVVAVLAAEVCARWWFFTAEGSPRMPGALR